MVRQASAALHEPGGRHFRGAGRAASSNPSREEPMKKKLVLDIQH